MSELRDVNYVDVNAAAHRPAQSGEQGFVLRVSCTRPAR